MLCFEPVTEVSMRQHDRVEMRGKTSEGTDLDPTGKARESSDTLSANSLECADGID
jgi:hypothetical protein